MNDEIRYEDDFDLFIYDSTDYNRYDVLLNKICIFLYGIRYGDSMMRNDLNYSVFLLKVFSLRCWECKSGSCVFDDSNTNIGIEIDCNGKDPVCAKQDFGKCANRIIRKL